MNRLGYLVLALMASGSIFAGIAFTRGRIDGAATAAVVLIFFAIAITAWATSNRKRTEP